MKPIVIYLDKNEEIKISKKDFEKYINDAYDAGYAAGYANGKNSNYTYPWWNTSPTITTPNTPQPLKITWDTNTPEINLPQVTCDGVNDLGSYTIKTAGSGATYDCKTGELKSEKT